MSEIIVEKLRHVYSAGTPFEVAAIEDIDLVIPQGQLVGIIGHTGSGKSTFIQHMNALLAPSAGKVRCGGKDINESKLSRRDVKHQVGLVFQYPEYQLFEETVYKDIAFGPKNMKLSEEEIDQRVREAAGFVGVEEELFEKSPLELSGGQKRRIAIAGVIAMRPGVLILDEPTAVLTPQETERLFAILKSMKAQGKAIVLISHNMDDVARIAERIIVFSHGRVVMDGSAGEVFSRAEELIDIGLDVPHATALAMALRKQGLPLPEGIYTHEQLLSAILEIRGAAVC